MYDMLNLLPGTRKIQAHEAAGEWIPFAKMMG